ncbi:Rieske (2Fe-2S) protein [Legionella jordanis]|uniref:Dioxygenase, ferredoxin subunit n=1 Tax=Legionella jordanis TaxID=456 RepID=A0A0W0VG25_9GAMM|nr:Rieske (2Fe-2S) protein [Legionella jordanis]KTD19092.1 dioxygenase, ferredoxin subunit [Legionella jordanis]RMW99310.1 Rieske (2Fe-2S) protein [Legionella jordanis]VEH12942.1 dioxygenase, ferredoxin subunit [Legionella jordanis]HAT8715283.1 Rieske 2Fe-2S domain-containing protein [Legionella jordanis]
MSSWKPAVTLSELQKKGRHCATIDGHKILFIWNNNSIHAVASQCPHFKLPLTKAVVTEENTIVCPFHKSAFNLESGKPECWTPWPPAVGTVLGKISKPKHLRIYPVRIDDDMISVDVRENQLSHLAKVD